MLQTALGGRQNIGRYTVDYPGQAVVGCISWVEADDILMALNITMLGVLTILAVCQQTGCCKREIAALKCIEDVRIPQLRLALFIQKLLPGELYGNAQAYQL